MALIRYLNQIADTVTGTIRVFESVNEAKREMRMERTSPAAHTADQFRRMRHESGQKVWTTVPGTATLGSRVRNDLTWGRSSLMHSPKKTKLQSKQRVPLPPQQGDIRWVSAA